MSGSRSLQNAQQKHLAIVQAAEDLFLQQGFSATSMDEVASVAGVTKQTVYRYLSSKEELFSAVMEKIRNDEPVSYAFGDKDIDQELKNFGCRLLSFHLKPAALGLYKLMLSEGGRNELGERFMNAGPNRVMRPLVQFLVKHFPDMDGAEFHASMFVNMILAPRNQCLMHNKASMSRVEIQAHVERVVALFLRGVFNYSHNTK